MKQCKRIALGALAVLVAGLVLAPVAHAQQDVITTVVGGGPNDIPALKANIQYPYEVAIDSQGNYYFVAQASQRIFKIAKSTGIITVVAGNGVAGYGGDGGPATAASLNGPTGVAVDNAYPPNVFIYDQSNCLIRKVSPTGIMSTIAGLVSTPFQPNCQPSGDGGPANKAGMDYGFGIAVDPVTDDVYFADDTNGSWAAVRKIAGGVGTGIISTVAGNNNNCGGAPADGTLATNANLCHPQAIAVDRSVSPPNLFITSWGERTVREVMGATNKIYNVAGQPYQSGYIDNVVATSAQFVDPWQPTVQVSGGVTTITLPDFNNNRVRQFTLTYKGGIPVPGIIKTIAGNGSGGYCGEGGPALNACVNGTGLAVDTSGNFFIGDTASYRLREIVKSTQDIVAVEGWGGAPNTTEVNYSNPVGISNVPGTGVTLYQPTGVFADPTSHNVYIGGAPTQAAYVFNSSNGEVSALAGNGIQGFAGDGTAANSASVEFNTPQDAAKDLEGNVYISDSYNCAVREINAKTGIISTVAGGSEGSLNGCGYNGDGGPAQSAQLNFPIGLAVDASNNLYISEWSNCIIRRVDASTQVISTFMGLPGQCGYNGDGIPATAAGISHAQEIAFDGSGNLYIADAGNNRIRKVDVASGIISTVAGNGNAAYTGDGAALSNALNNPLGVAVDTNGNVFASDENNSILRWIDPAGNMVTFAGSPPGSPQGSNGFGGDGGLATSARFSSPDFITQDAAGNFYAADDGNDRIRKVAAFAGFGRSVAQLTFDKQAVGTTSDFQPVTLSAIGPVTINSVTAPAGFSEIDDCSGVELTAGETCEIDVYFNPAQSGALTGSLTIASNAFFSSQASSVSLVGEGAGLSITGSLAFPAQLIGSSSTKTVTLQNSGPAVKITSISIPGTTSFTVSGGTCPNKGGTLAASSTCTIIVTFTGTVTGTFEHALAVISNDPGSPLLFPVTGTLSQLTFTPAAGTYTAPQSVKIAGPASWTIYYTTNGTTPTTASTKYTAPIAVASSETIKAIATATGYTSSSLASAAYVITPVAATPTFSPSAGTYTAAQTVKIADTTTGASIYYTTNGATPTTASTKYTAAIAVATSETIKAIAVATGYTQSAVASAAYVITPPAATPTFTPAAGTYTAAQTVKIADTTTGASIYYTTNGTTPTTASTKYTATITVATSETVKAIAVATGYTQSAVASAAYVITPPAATPTFTPAAGTYTAAQTVKIADTTTGATIYYTTNGATPTTASTKFTAAIAVAASETIKAIAVATGYTQSAVASAAYVITPPAATPTFTPAAGTYTTAQTVKIADTTTGATIYYTTNGTAPTTASAKYTAPITVSSTETIEAVAVATGYSQSATATAKYTIP